MRRSTEKKKRCEWCLGDELMTAYHDTEWGTPLHDDKKLFEFVALDSFQAGLSWQIILHKRENFRKAFDNFRPDKIAKYNKKKITELLSDSGIVRNRLKILATIENAKGFGAIKKEFGSFDNYLWQFVGGYPKKNKFRRLEDIPDKTPEAEAMSKDLRKRGFRFAGPTVCYAFMQGAGLVNDHLTYCFRYNEVS